MGREENIFQEFPGLADVLNPELSVEERLAVARDLRPRTGHSTVPAYNYMSRLHAEAKGQERDVLFQIQNALLFGRCPLSEVPLGCA